MTGFDRRAERWIVAHRVAALDDVFVWLSRAGSFGLVWIALGAAVAIALRRPVVLVLVLLADVAADLSATGLKHAVERSRPDPAQWLTGASGFSFPSGHAATSFACALVLAAAVPRLAPAFLALAAAVAFSRLYVGVHYPLDVLGGALLGVAVATALLLLERARRRSRPAPLRG